MSATKRRRKLDTWGGSRKPGRQGGAARVTVACKVPREVRAALKLRARRNHTTVSSLLLIAIELLLATKRKTSGKEAGS